MSRIGNAPIAIKENVEINVSPENVVTVKGPKGSLVQQVDSGIVVKVDDGQILLSRKSEEKEKKAMHGLYRALLFNMVEGVSEGYVRELELIGVGYRANVKGQLLELALGFSHAIVFEIPEEVKVTAVAEKGKNPTIKLESYDKQLIGQVAAKIRSLRPPEPYKGKGVRYVGEYVRRKAGKSAASK